MPVITEQTRAGTAVRVDDRCRMGRDSTAPSLTPRSYLTAFASGSTLARVPR